MSNARSAATEAMNAMNLLKSFVSNEAKEQVIAAIKNEIRTYLQVKLTEWSEHIPAVVRPDAQKLADEAKAQRRGSGRASSQFVR